MQLRVACPEECHGQLVCLFAVPYAGMQRAQRSPCVWLGPIGERPCSRPQCAQIARIDSLPGGTDQQPAVRRRRVSVVFGLVGFNHGPIRGVRSQQVANVFGCTARRRIRACQCVTQRCGCAGHQGANCCAEGRCPVPEPHHCAPLGNPAGGLCGRHAICRLLDCGEHHRVAREKQIDYMPNRWQGRVAIDPGQHSLRRRRQGRGVPLRQWRKVNGDGWLRTSSGKYSFARTC